MDKGTRVRITGGRDGVGTTGTVFWKGENRWGPGERLGVRGDDGQTYWVQDSDVEVATGAPPPSAGPTFSKGDRVSFEVRGEPGTGTVFWVGQNRHGPGQRLGVRNDADPTGDDAVWLDARQARPLTGEEAAPRPPRGAPRWEEPDDVIPADYGRGQPVTLDDMPPAPPLSDEEVDRWAALQDADDDE